MLEYGINNDLSKWSIVEVIDSKTHFTELIVEVIDSRTHFTELIVEATDSRTHFTELIVFVTYLTHMCLIFTNVICFGKNKIIITIIIITIILMQAYTFLNVEGKIIKN